MFINFIIAILSILLGFIIISNFENIFKISSFISSKFLFLISRIILFLNILFSSYKDYKKLNIN